MTIENLFVTATREKYRFESKVGLLTVEDLWELPLTSSNKASLDNVAITLNRKLKDGEEESFVSAKKKDVVTSNKLEIVKHVIAVREAENEQKIAEAKRREQRETIQRLIEQKEVEGLHGKSVDELRELLKNL